MASSRTTRRQSFAQAQEPCFCITLEISPAQLACLPLDIATTHALPNPCQTALALNKSSITPEACNDEKIYSCMVDYRVSKSGDTLVMLPTSGNPGCGSGFGFISSECTLYYGKAPAICPPAYRSRLPASSLFYGAVRCPLHSSMHAQLASSLPGNNIAFGLFEDGTGFAMRARNGGEGRRAPLAVNIGGPCSGEYQASAGLRQQHCRGCTIH